VSGDSNKSLGFRLTAMHGGDNLTPRSDVYQPTAIHRLLPLFAGISIGVTASAQARAHTVPNAQSLYDLCRAAEVVAVGRITYVATPAPNVTTLPPVDAEVLELLREGGVEKGTIRFLPHRHGDDQYAIGEELLLFLDRTRSPEQAREAKYEAVEAIADRFVLPRERHAEWIDAARKYVALGRGPRNTTDARELGRISIAMLASPETKLAHLALRDLTLAGTSAVIVEADVPVLLRIVDDASRPAMLRVGLLSELERRKFTPVGSHWVSVLDTTPPSERSAVISGAKSRWFVPEVNAALVSIVDRGTADEAISAARAVGAEGNETAVDALVRAATREPEELRIAALGSLRKINTTLARDKLAEFAKAHPDDKTRKVAANEVALLPSAPVVPKNSGVTTPTAAPRASSNRAVWVVLGVLVLVIAGVVARKWARPTAN
jgi:hypothetical protein